MPIDYQSYNITVLAPEVILALFAMAVLVAGAFFEERRRMLPALALLGTIVAAAAACALWNEGHGEGLFFGPHTPLNDTAIYVVDNFSLAFKFIFLLTLGVTIVISGRFLHARSGDRHTVAGEYYALLMLATIGMMMVASARDLLVVFLGIETLSIALYVLAGFARSRLMSNEAALKYFLLGAFATGFLLYGIALTYAAGHTTLLPELAKGTGSIDAPLLFYVGIALLLIGLGFKAALVPFHQWTPDVYEGSPTPITGFMAVGAKAAAFAAILRVLPGTFGNGPIEASWHGIVLVMAVLTMTVGNIVAIAQSSLKRMLAYSSIAHAGYLLIGVLAAGNALRNGGPNAAADATDAQAGVIFYLIGYALMNLGAFAALVYMENVRDPAHTEDANLNITDIQGIAAREPVAAAALTVFLISLAGIPPTAGFFGKLYIFTAAINQQLYGPLLVAVLNTVISVYFYLRPVVVMYMQGEGGLAVAETVAPDGTVAARPTSTYSVAITSTIALCAIAVLAMVVLQVPILWWAEQAARISVGR